MTCRRTADSGTTDGSDNSSENTAATPSGQWVTLLYTAVGIVMNSGAPTGNAPCASSNAAAGSHHAPHRAAEAG